MSLPVLANGEQGIAEKAGCVILALFKAKSAKPGAFFNNLPDIQIPACTGMTHCCQAAARVSIRDASEQGVIPNKASFRRKPESRPCCHPISEKQDSSPSHHHLRLIARDRSQPPRSIPAPFPFRRVLHIPIKPLQHLRHEMLVGFARAEPVRLERQHHQTGGAAIATHGLKQAR